MFFDDGFIPECQTHRIDGIIPVATFISNKMIVLRNTLITSTDIEEQVDTLSKLILCQGSMSLLSLAYLTDDVAYLDQAKHLYRGI